MPSLRLDARYRRTTRTPLCTSLGGATRAKTMCIAYRKLPARQRGGFLPKDTLYFGCQIRFSEVCPPTAQRCLRPRPRHFFLPKTNNSNFLPGMMF